MKIVSFKICPFVQRVTTLLALKGIEYEVEYIDLSRKPQWFLVASPNSQVPILVLDDGHVLFESDAIVEYVDEVSGNPVYANDPIRRARERAWAYLATKHYLVQCSAQRSADEGTLSERRRKLDAAFTKITTQLADAPFVGGRSMGMVDVAWTTLLHRTAIVAERAGYDFLEPYPRLQDWRARIMETGIPDVSVSADFEEKFSAFYLAPSTYLGRLAERRNGRVCTGPCECRVEDMACCA